MGDDVLYVCFDKNMERRLFHMRSTAERHAIGAIDEYVKREATHHQPVTPAGGEVEKLIDLLEDVAVQHEGLESYGDSCGPRMCIRACRGAIEALRATHPPVADAALVEEWFMCHHPAWPDPLPVGNSADEALRWLASNPHPEAWLLRTLKGGRVEYRGDALAALNQRGGGDHG